MNSPPNPPSPPHMPPPPPIPPQRFPDPLESEPLVTFRLSLAACLRCLLFGVNLAVVIVGTMRYRVPALFFLILLYLSLFWNFALLAHPIIRCLRSNPDSQPSGFQSFPGVVVKFGSWGFACGKPRTPGLPTATTATGLKFPGEEILERGAGLLGGGDKKKQWFKRWVRVSIVDVFFGFFGIFGAVGGEVFWSGYWGERWSMWEDDTPVVVLLGFYALVPLPSLCSLFYSSRFP